MINEFVQASAWILLPFVAGVATGIIAMAMAWSMMRKDEEEMDCEGCEVIEMCRKMFGKYWNDKSDGGKGCEHPVKASLAAGAMENPETESLKGMHTRTGEYVPRAGEVEILSKPHAATCGGNLADAATSDASRKMPWNTITRDVVGPGHGKPNFIQEVLL